MRYGHTIEVATTITVYPVEDVAHGGGHVPRPSLGMGGEVRSRHLLNLRRMAVAGPDDSPARTLTEARTDADNGDRRFLIATRVSTTEHHALKVARRMSAASRAIDRHRPRPPLFRAETRCRSISLHPPGRYWVTSSSVVRDVGIGGERRPGGPDDSGELVDEEVEHVPRPDELRGLAGE